MGDVKEEATIAIWGAAVFGVAMLLWFLTYVLDRILSHQHRMAELRTQLELKRLEMRNEE